MAWEKAGAGLMSAAASNSGDREIEALRRAQRAHEPSMEEILASIRTIIAEEREPAKAEPAKPSPTRPAAVVAGPQIVYSKDTPAERRTAQEPQAPDVGDSSLSDPPKVVWRQPEPAASDSVEDGKSADDGALLSPATDEAVTSAFAALSAELAARSAELADEMVREMLRPMLRAWLDENLPEIVERLVRAEIERLARGAR
jgi:cell pole-organizing protein PopZ